MSIEDTIRHNRIELACTIHEFLDQLEVATAGAVRDADQTIVKIRQLVDLLADKVVVPNLGDMAARLDRLAVEELLKFKDHKEVRSILETAEAFSRRQNQIDSSNDPVTSPTHTHYSITENHYSLNDPDAARRELARRGVEFRKR
ncbi:hypothetical protein [Rhodococcus aetherivorans]|uniref:hypothetical protein n=1 Tax=Rhodococcus aetherivorans TaxID=191292 RepID=UPI00388D7DCB